MQGEGSHHAHHAKNDIPATRLSRVVLEVEAAHPDIKTSSRGHGGTSDDEDGRAPQTLQLSDPPPCQRAWRRSCKVEECIDRFSSDPTAAITGIAGAIIDSCIETNLLADLGLLRGLHSKMGLDRFEHTGLEMPISSWSAKIWSEANKDALRSKAAFIKEQVLSSAAQVGAAFIEARSASNAPSLDSRREGLKECYYELFEAVARAFIPDGPAAECLLQKLASTLPAPSQDIPAPPVRGTARSGILRNLLEAPIPKDVTRITRQKPYANKGTEERAAARIATIFAECTGRQTGPRSRL